jgi:hypothetical protein
MGGNVPPWGKYCIVWGKILSKTMDSGGGGIFGQACVKTVLSINLKKKIFSKKKHRYVKN